MHAMGIDPSHTAADIQVELRELYRERAVAGLHGITSDHGYMADLLDDIATYENALVGAAVTEIATLRAVLDGPLVG
jgi:hypothetical protein